MPHSEDARPGAGPLWVEQLHLDAPLPSLAPPTPEHVGAVVLVRLHGRPLGQLHVDYTAGPVVPAQLAAVVEQQLGQQVRDHLLADGLPPAAVTADGLPQVDAPCTWRARLAPLVDELPLVSVVIATCRGEERLARTLRGIAAQTYPALEVLVVDNAPGQDRLRPVVDALDDDRFVLLEERQPGVAAARNRGLHAARGQVVCFTDDDVDVDPDWVGGMTAPFYEDPAVACVSGLIMPARLATQAQRLFEEFGGFTKGFAPRTYRLSDAGHGPLYPYNVGLFGSGASMAVRRAEFIALGSFAPELGAGTVARGGEDLDAYLNVLRAGLALHYEPAALVWHEHRQTMAQLTQQIHGYGVGLSAMIAKRLLESPSERRAVLRLLPAAARHLLAPASAKNSGKQHGYPKRLNAYELAGLAYGPAAYVRSRRRSRAAQE